MEQPEKKKATHEIPSGLGGKFDVSILEDLGDKIKVRVHYPTRDFDGMVFNTLKHKLIPLRKKPFNNS